ncbi:MAG: ImmA/IrrE family metallo-endopeptidase [Alicyclobacillaceae bacterium]|nr:ImmA/IrrE family metallo-endopeptidase [Alicyclobacillaceae bacterium]
MWVEPSQAAREARRRLGFSSDVFFPPREIFELIEQSDGRLTIIRYPLDLEQTSALIACARDRYVILIDSAKTLGRQVFSLAHEYAHYIEHKEHMGGPERIKSNPKVECWANAFATEFLMPREAIERWLAFHRTSRRDEAMSLLDFLRLQQAMGVSFEAALNRLNELRLIRTAQYDEWKTFSPVRMADKFGLPLDLYRPDRAVKIPEEYRGLWIEAYEAGKASFRRLEEALKLIGVDARSIEGLDTSVGIEDVT